VLLAVSLGTARETRAAVILHVEATATREAGAAVGLTVINMGGEPADEVAPEVVYQHRTLEGEAVSIAPGGRREWRFAIDPPPARSTMPALVRVRHRDPHGRGGMTPAVVLMTAPDAAPSAVRGRLDLTPIVSIGRATLELENTGPDAVTGRVLLLLPAGLRTDPQTVPAQVLAGGRTSVSFQVESVEAPPGSRLRVFAVLEYTSGGAGYAVLAETMAVVGERRPHRLPLVVGFLALLAAGITLALALRSTARRAA
jgi:hypothetical protein